MKTKKFTTYPTGVPTGVDIPAYFHRTTNKKNLFFKKYHTLFSFTTKKLIKSYCSFFFLKNTKITINHILKKIQLITVLYYTIKNQSTNVHFYGQSSYLNLPTPFAVKKAMNKILPIFSQKLTNNSNQHHYCGGALLPVIPLTTKSGAVVHPKTSLYPYQGTISSHSPIIVKLFLTKSVLKTFKKIKLFDIQSLNFYNKYLNHLFLPNSSDNYRFNPNLFETKSQSTFTTTKVTGSVLSQTPPLKIAILLSSLTKFLTDTTPPAIIGTALPKSQPLLPIKTLFTPLLKKKSRILNYNISTFNYNYLYLYNYTKKLSNNDWSGNNQIPAKIFLKKHTIQFLNKSQLDFKTSKLKLFFEYKKFVLNPLRRKYKKKPIIQKKLKHNNGNYFFTIPFLVWDFMVSPYHPTKGVSTKLHRTQLTISKLKKFDKPNNFTINLHNKHFNKVLTTKFSFLSNKLNSNTLLPRKHFLVTSKNFLIMGRSGIFFHKKSHAQILRYNFYTLPTPLKPLKSFNSEVLKCYSNFACINVSCNKLMAFFFFSTSLSTKTPIL
jgi:hypothetical protein